MRKRKRDVQRRPSDRNRDRRYTQKNKTVKQNWWDLVVKPGTNHETDSYVSTIKSVGWQGEIGKRHLAKEGSNFFYILLFVVIIPLRPLETLFCTMIHFTWVRAHVDVIGWTLFSYPRVSQGEERGSKRRAFAWCSRFSESIGCSN